MREEYNRLLLEKFAQLIAAARTRNLPIIYTHSNERPDRVRAGGWVRKHSRVFDRLEISRRIGNDIGDYAETRDNVVPEDLVDSDWENPATINDTWGFKTDDENWKSPEELIQKLVDIVSKNGNYLLNVGPTADGVIPQPSVERLESMGRWLEVNGESV